MLVELIKLVYVFIISVWIFLCLLFELIYIILPFSEWAITVLSELFLVLALQEVGGLALLAIGDFLVPRMELDIYFVENFLWVVIVP